MTLTLQRKRPRQRLHAARGIAPRPPRRLIMAHPTSSQPTPTPTRPTPILVGCSELADDYGLDLLQVADERRFAAEWHAERSGK
jgi:hypothetical protein